MCRKATWAADTRARRAVGRGAWPPATAATLRGGDAVWAIGTSAQLDSLIACTAFC